MSDFGRYLPSFPYLSWNFFFSTALFFFLFHCTTIFSVENQESNRSFHKSTHILFHLLIKANKFSIYFPTSKQTDPSCWKISFWMFCRMEPLMGIQHILNCVLLFLESPILKQLIGHKGLGSFFFLHFFLF